MYELFTSWKQRGQSQSDSSTRDCVQWQPKKEKALRRPDRRGLNQ